MAWRSIRSREPASSAGWTPRLRLWIDERSSSDLQFPMWIYYLSLPTGGALMAVRYVIRLFRYLFHYDPRTMKPGHVVHETVEGLEAPKSQ